MSLEKRSIIYILIISGFVSLALVVTPLQIRKILTFNKEIKQLQDNISQVNEDLNSKASFEADIEKLKRDIMLLKGAVITTQAISTLQAYLSTKAKEKGLEIVETGASPAQPCKTINGEKFLHIPINIHLRGGFHNLGHFLAEIENGDYPLQLKQLTIAGSKPYHSIDIKILALVKE